MHAETGMLQRRVVRELAAFGDAASWLDYRLYLCRMYGFLSPVELAFGEHPELPLVIPDTAARCRKAALLAEDLAALGVERAQLAHLPRISTPVLATLPEALGWMYVVEASTLDGVELGRRLALRLPPEIQGASAYLRCYGGETYARWAAFGAALDEYVDRADDAACDHVVLAATDCFIRLHRWLAPSSASSLVRAGRVHA